MSLRARLVRLVTSWYFDSLDMAGVDVRKVRRRWNRLGKLLIPAIGVRVHRDNVAGLHAEWLVPKSAPEGKLIFYLHGGAYGSYRLGCCSTFLLGFYVRQTYAGNRWRLLRRTGRFA